MTDTPDTAGLVAEATAHFELLRRQGVAITGEDISGIRNDSSLSLAKRVVNLKNAAQWAIEHGTRLATALASTQEELKNELHDLEMVCHEASLVYSHVTGGFASKPNTKAFEIISLAEAHYSRIEEENRQEEALASQSERGPIPCEDGWVSKAAASIAHLVDEWTDRGWNDEGRLKFVASDRLTRALVEDGVVEKLARVLYEAPGKHKPASRRWEDADEGHRGQFRRMASVSIELLAALAVGGTE